MPDESKPGQTITVEVAPNVANPDDVVQLGVQVGQTAQTWLKRMQEREAAQSAASLVPQGARRS